MQRSGDVKKSQLRIFIYLILLFVYEPLTTIFIYLPPLLGVVVWLLFQKRDVITWLFGIAYIYLYEIDHDFVRYTLFFNLFITLSLLQILYKYFVWNVMLKIASSAFFYIGIILIHIVLGYILQTIYPLDFWIVGYYMLLDILVLVIYEK
ncbi:hypothetical protein NitYY0826_C1007 [Nitratiruptor sp. YY08-26]|uniref:hypothetical protein n=1 Tax=unclassified Nitratiruptor TaxID=2624044 RepID=UPI001916226D|nr:MULTISPECIES: hypothetical protein [unclassified Nitratiruptor]BCD62136.1 hypothetical protein NitYY0813_C1005 [Nitratiruptor sp. YY08-13]BCD66072.1 hypothetical protein NitYY0826_C1007 [Nitratiruptor sp. YY08-26]